MPGPSGHVVLTLTVHWQPKGRILRIQVTCRDSLSLGVLLTANSVPHPSENHIQVRIQMYGTHEVPSDLSRTLSASRVIDHLSSLDALLDALASLDTLFLSVQAKYLASLQEGRYERWDERS
jgi:hypothetical protein